MGTLKKEYQAIVWVGDSPGFRVVLEAEDASAARRLLKEKYGADVKASIWNEEDANKPR